VEKQAGELIAKAFRRDVCMFFCQAVTIPRTQGGLELVLTLGDGIGGDTKLPKKIVRRFTG
jgi:hypothetical protein